MKMNDFDKILKDAIDGYEAPFNSSVWENISSELSPMEDSFRNAVKDYKAPYSTKAWSAIKGQINSSYSLLNWAIGSAAVVALVVGGYYFFEDDSNSISNENNTISSTLSENRTNPIHHTQPNKVENFTAIEDNAQENQIDNLLENLNNDDSEALSNNGINALDETLNENTIVFQENNDQTTNDNDEKLGVADESTGQIDNSDSGLTPSGVNLSNDSTDETINYSAEFTSNHAEICQGETILFNPRLVQSDIKYVWNFDDGVISNDKVVNHTFNKSGIYNVTLTLIDESNSIKLANYSTEIIVNLPPIATFELSRNTNSIPTVTFSATKDNSNKYFWKVNNRMISDKNEVQHTFREKGKYEVQLIAQNEYGCTAEEEQVLEIDNNYNLFAPLAFTPDQISNNTFIPNALLLMDNPVFTMTVYNQKGNLVYQTNDANSPWNGIDINNNSAAATGGYVWSVVLKNSNGVVEHYTNNVLLIR